VIAVALALPQRENGAIRRSHRCYRPTSVGRVYVDFRRRRIAPKPTNALPRSVKAADSGTSAGAQVESLVEHTPDTRGCWYWHSCGLSGWRCTTRSRTPRRSGCSANSSPGPARSSGCLRGLTRCCEPGAGWGWVVRSPDQVRGPPPRSSIRARQHHLEIGAKHFKIRHLRQSFQWIARPLTAPSAVPRHQKIRLPRHRRSPSSRTIRSQRFAPKRQQFLVVSTK
jgi:hypothetical protein